MKYIDADKLKKYIEYNRNCVCDGLDCEDMDECQRYAVEYIDDILSFIASLQQEPRFPQYDNIVEKIFGAGNLEGWEFREAEMLVALAKEELLKSLQQKQLVNKDLGTLITCDIIEMTVKKAIDKPQDKEKEEELMTRKINYLRLLEENCVQQEQPEVDLEKELNEWMKYGPHTCYPWCTIPDAIEITAEHFYELGQRTKYQQDREEFAKLKAKEWMDGFDEGLSAGKDKLPEIELDKFTEKIKTFQERYKHPEIVSIKGAMAFMARLFYQYPNVARQWYDNLPKTTMD